MFYNIQHERDGSWICYCDQETEDFVGSCIMYAGEGTDSVTGADEYWSI